MARSRIVALLILAGVAAGAFAAVLISKGRGETIEVDGPRPVAMAVQELVETHGYHVSYEDPRYEYSGDFHLVPKGGAFTVDVRISKGPQSVLEQIVLAAEAAVPGLQFEVRADHGMYQVVPTAARDRDGNRRAQSPILDVPISLATEERNADDTLRAICSAVSAAANIEVSAGMTGFGLGGLVNEHEPKYSIGAQGEPARAVLKRALDAIGLNSTKTTWMLFCDGGACALNLLRIPEPVVATPVAAAPSKVSQDPANDAHVVPGGNQ